MSPPSLCESCATIAYTNPSSGPEFRQNGSGFSTHLYYAQHESVDELKLCAESLKCHLCAMIFSLVEDFDAGLIFDDDWEHADTVLAEATSEFSTEVVPAHFRKACVEIFGVEATRDADSENFGSSIILEFIFRDPLPFESETRCTDIKVHWSSCDERHSFMGFCLVSGLIDMVETFCTNRCIAEDTTTGSPNSLELARLWLRLCDSTHKACGEGNANDLPLLPTRVIDIRDPSQPPFLHLSLTNQRGQYVALSHCWGTAEQFKTELASIENRCAGIDLNGIPQTFKDAIYVARHLGFPYIWIDSLCIIQDSSDDWQREAKEMGRYYRDASLSVFALGSNGDEEGCFKPRDGDMFALCRTPMFDGLVSVVRQTPPSATFVQRLYERKHGFARFSTDDERHGFENFRKIQERWPLQRRGWTLQEWVLSTRALGFSPTEIRWVCQSMSACECVPEGLLDIPRSQGGKPQVEVKRLQRRTLDDTSDLNLTEAWYEIVMEFSNRLLTYPSDKLPALAGMAQEFSKVKLGHYVAGLWKDDNLRNHLGWYVPPGWQTSRPSDYRAPTWSWASIDGKFNTHSLRAAYEPETDLERRAVALLCEVLDCWTVPLTSLNPLGSVASGALSLRGRLRRAKVQPQENPSENFKYRLVLRDEDNDTALGCLDPDDTTALLPTSGVWCMPLIHNWMRLLRCLALVEADEKDIERAAKHGSLCEKVFKRVGMVELNWEQARDGNDVVDAFVVGNDDVDYQINYSRSTIGSLLVWLEEAKIEEISVI